MIHIDSLIDDRYRVESLIARGGMADVFRAHDQRLARDVAIKVLREVQHQERFESEARTLARLNHPHLVQLLDAGKFDGSAYLVLEFINGPTLSQALADGPLGASRTARVGAAVCEALAYIHAKGIVHRDIKPSNLLLDSRRTVCLSDFGIARLLGDPSLTATQMTVGTMAYLAPEQLRGERVTPAADIYSLGLVLLECLTARRAFDGPPVEAGMARLSRGPHIPITLPGAWPALLHAMTAQDPRARPAAEDIARRLAGRAPPLQSRPAQPRPQPQPRPQYTTGAIATPSQVRPAAARQRRKSGGRTFGRAVLILLLLVAATASVLAVGFALTGNNPFSGS